MNKRQRKKAAKTLLKELDDSWRDWGPDNVFNMSKVQRRLKFAYYAARCRHARILFRICVKKLREEVDTTE